MTDTLTRLARIMHRLRLRSPATEAEKREWATIRQAASAAATGSKVGDGWIANPDGSRMHPDPYTITEADVGQPTIRAFGRVWFVSGFLGRVLPQDAGKRVYQRGGILQVENEEQRAARLATVYNCECADSGCECADAGCRAVYRHRGGGTCGQAAVMHLFRVDMGHIDEPLVFCEPCGDDALESGVFVAGADLPCSEVEEAQIDALLNDILAP